MAGAVRILHISDFHFGRSISYDRTQVFESLAKFIARSQSKIDAFAITGDIAFSGKKDEYDEAEKLIRPLIDAAKIDRSNVFIVPGNHDVDRSKVRFLSRTLVSQNDSDEYFGSDEDCPHISRGQEEFREFYKRICGTEFQCRNAIGGSYALVASGIKVEVVLLNTATFCRDDDDHGKLWVGRPSITAFPELSDPAEIRIMLGHHPIDWLSEIESSKIAAAMDPRFDAYLRGHLHKGNYQQCATSRGAIVHVATGASYQGPGNPISANIVEISSKKIRIEPLRYSDDPFSVWVPDLAQFGDDASPYVEFPLREEGGVSDRGQKNLSFDHHSLFRDSQGEPIFIEPRLYHEPFGQADPGQKNVKSLSVEEILARDGDVQIEAEIEYGSTVLSHFINFVIKSGMSEDSYILNARDIPDYHAKMEKYINEQGFKKGSIAIISDFLERDHKKMLECLRSIEYFSRIIVISISHRSVSINDHERQRPLFDSPPVYLWPLDRSSVRKIALAVFDPKIESSVNSAVEKTYSDLIDLAIPLTPTNVIMYLFILRDEGDFTPVDRVSIMQRYINDALAKADDQTNSAFGIRDRLALFSEFVFSRFIDGGVSFSHDEWVRFCRDYSSRKLVDVDAEKILWHLRVARIIVSYNGLFHLRYAYLYDFLVGLRASSSADALESFLSQGHHQRLNHVVEVIAGLTSVPEVLVNRLHKDLRENISAFKDKYFGVLFDPLENAIWKIGDEDGGYWDKVAEQIEAGTASSSAIDEVRQSVWSESRSASQQVIIQEFVDLETELFRALSALEDALRVAVNLDGQLKMDSLRSLVSTYLIVLEIAAVFSRQLALSRVVHWGGITFINEGYRPNSPKENLPQMVPWVVSGVDRNLPEVAGDRIGTKRLGKVFRASLKSWENISTFERYMLLGFIVRTKPPGWEEDVEEIIRATSYEDWRQNSFVNVLTKNFKYGLNSGRQQEKLKRLIALVEAKRSSHRRMPGAKSISKMQRYLEKAGRFDNL